ncbi:MAG: tetratricopeptide repeat protein, partial [Bacteroidetes bacterium]|nr:tetratricopeptide repeat protein [Bacteroidota bacterium]
RSEIHTRLAFEARAQSRWESSVYELNQAENQWYRFDPISTPLAWYRGMAFYNLGQMDAAFASFYRAWELCPFHPHVLNNLGTAYVIKGDTGQSVKYFEQAVKESPHFNDAWLNLAAVRFNSKQLDAAYKALCKVDTSCDQERYKPSVYLILRTRANVYLEKLNDAGLARYAGYILDDKKWLWAVFKKSLKEKRDFNTQLCLDALWVRKDDFKNEHAH